MNNLGSHWPRYLIVFLFFSVLIVGGFIFYQDKYSPAQPPGNLEKVTVAQFGDFFLYLPLYVAKDKGFFAQQGLDVGIVNTGGDDKTFAAVMSGDAQFGVAD